MSAEIIERIQRIGHYGIQKTLHMLTNHYWWRGMTEQVKEVLKNCRDCQLIHVSFNEPKELHPIAVKGVYHKVGIDLIGPLQPTTTRGNNYIITSVDYLTKNVEARAVPNKESQTVADFFWDEVVCRHGNVAEVISDRGREFHGSFTELLDSCHIDHRFTSAHHPQSNGLTERFNETLTVALRKLEHDHPEDWDTYISTILLGYRASVQASTQYSPIFLLHGYEMPLPVRALRPTAVPMLESGDIDPTAQRIDTHNALIPALRVTHITAAPPQHAMQIGDFVLVKKHEKVRVSGNKRGKLASKVDGPFILHA